MQTKSYLSTFLSNASWFTSKDGFIHLFVMPFTNWETVALALEKVKKCVIFLYVCLIFKYNGEEHNILLHSVKKFVNKEIVVSLHAGHN